MIRVIPIIGIFLLASCMRQGTSRTVGQDIPIDSLRAVALNDTLALGFAKKILVSDSLLIVYDDLQRDRLQFFDAGTGGRLASFGSIGQGDKELIAPGNISLSYSTGEFMIYDNARKSMLACRVEDIPDNRSDEWYVIRLPDYKIRPREVFPVDSNVFVAQHGRPRFTLSCDGEEIWSYDQFPLLEDLKDDEAATRMFFLTQTLTALSPDGTRMVQGTTLGTVMQIFKVNDAQIEPIVHLNVNEPVFNIVKGQIVAKPGSVYGFACLQTTDKHIYATIHGVPDPQVYPSDIYVFDWDGRTTGKLAADRQICCFGVDNNNGCIYAIVLNDQGEQEIVRLERKHV